MPEVFHMRIFNLVFKLSISLILVFQLTACTTKQTKKLPAATEKGNSNAPAAQKTATPPPAPLQLPVRYQQPTYLIENEFNDETGQSLEKEATIKVGANITSTKGPQPLWDIMKRLAKLKKMSVSWASDVDQNAMVDVDIRADDDFFKAIDNLLRQKDYFHEVKNNTIIVKYRETRQYHIAIPFMRQSYMTVTGGNFLSERTTGSGTEGTVKIASNQNEVDIWNNIKLNLDTILGIWSGRRSSDRLNTRTTELKYDESGKIVEKAIKENSLDSTDITGAEVKGKAEGKGESKTTKKESNATSTLINEPSSSKSGSGEISGNAEAISATQKYKQTLSGTYTLDEHLGLISVNAPRPLLKKVEQYLNTLKKNIYRQVTIEAKIIEVFLNDQSKVGLDWSQVLRGGNFSGTVEFGKQDGTGRGQVWPYESYKGPDLPNAMDMDPTRFVTKVLLNNFDFNVVLNAIADQGDTHVLSNPKITVMNGQPALLSVGTDVAYIKTITSETQADTNTVSFTAETDSVVEGVALGVVASILDDDTVILHLTPITTEIVNDTIPQQRFGTKDELVVGLPVIRYREMSTMVEVKNGEMLILGGLIDKINRKGSSGIPVVQEIPIIKYLFGYEEKQLTRRELVILLTPKVHTI